MKHLAAVLLACAGLAAQAQSFPNRPVTLVVPFPPRGGTDTGARLIAQKLAAKWTGVHRAGAHAAGPHELQQPGCRWRAAPGQRDVQAGHPHLHRACALARRRPGNCRSAGRPRAALVHLLPHLASGTHETRQAMAGRVFDNLHHYFAEGRLLLAAPTA